VRSSYCVVVAKAIADTYVMLKSSIFKWFAELKIIFECVDVYSRGTSIFHPLKAGACCRIEIRMDIIMAVCW
jgi:hypothetical protein